MFWSLVLSGVGVWGTGHGRGFVQILGPRANRCEVWLMRICQRKTAATIACQLEEPRCLLYDTSEDLHGNGLL